MKVTIAVAQIGQSDDPAENCRIMMDVLASAEVERADIVCFPETALTGCSSIPEGELHFAIAEQTKRMNKWCIYGGYTKRVGTVFNEVFVVNRHGQRVHVYQKRHLWAGEAKTVQAGQDENLPIDTEFGPIGVITCWDIAFPGEAQRLAGLGARIIFCPAYWYGPENGTTEVIEGLPLSLAFFCQAFFVLCDACTDETSARSRICSPRAVLVAADPKEQVITATVDLDEVNMLRQTFDCWKLPD